MNDALNHRDEAELDKLLALGRSDHPDVSADLMSRILADAALTASDRQSPALSIERTPGLFTTLLATVGGWGGAGGLVAATVAGIWIGVSPPQALESVTNAFFGTNETLSLFAADDIIGAEG